MLYLLLHDRLCVDRRVDVNMACQGHTAHLVLLLFTGREVRENMFEEVATLLHALDEGMMPISVFSPYLPIPAHFRRDKCVLQCTCVAHDLRPTAFLWIH